MRATARASTRWPAPARSKEFTGISDPYKVPAQPELRVDGAAAAPVLLARRIMALLRHRGLIQG